MKIQTINATKKKQVKAGELSPFSLIKFFHKKFGERVLDQAFIQPLLYLSYAELLKKKYSFIFGRISSLGE